MKRMEESERVRVRASERTRDELPLFFAQFVI